MGDPAASLRRLYLASLVEGTTLVALVCIAVPLKYAAGFPKATSGLGLIHGLAFLTYVAMIIDSMPRCTWTKGELARLIGLAFVPFGTFFNIGFLKRRATLSAGGSGR